MNPGRPFYFVASAAPEDLLPLPGRMGFDLREYLILFGAVLLVAAAAALVIVYAWKRRRDRRSHRHHRHHRRSGADAMAAGRAEAEAGSEGLRRRRRRRRHRPRNPTLAETGGLPPLRRDEPPAGDVSQAQPP